MGGVGRARQRQGASKVKGKEGKDWVVRAQRLAE
jgi:hypothetical protein